MRVISLLFLCVFFTASFFQVAFADSVVNICHIIKKHPRWYLIAKHTQKKWGVPVAIQMAIIEQESDFDAHAKNPKSTARGYAQVEDDIWGYYLKDVNKKARRTSFSSSSNFIGWYANQLKEQVGVSPKNAYQLYLAYHDGSDGYEQDLHSKKDPTKAIADHVKDVASLYKKELASC